MQALLRPQPLEPGGLCQSRGPFALEGDLHGSASTAPPPPRSDEKSTLAHVQHKNHSKVGGCHCYFFQGLVNLMSLE